MLSEDKINLNYLSWIKKLQSYDCYSEEMINEIGEKIKNASFSMTESSGSAYNGSMIDVVLNKLCKLAYYINENGFEKYPNLKVNVHMLMRVLLLQHISKSEIFVPQQQQWKAKNGFLYDYNSEIRTKLKCGERSAFMCSKYGIKLTEEEFEAITIIDKLEDKGECFLTPLSILVKSVNQMVQIDLRKTYLNNIEKETIEE